MRGKVGFVAVAVIAAVVGARSLNPRELYNEMYPVDTLKRDAFHICNDANPTFIRAVKVDRDACFNSMPHSIELALGWIHPDSALEKAALHDPSREAELLLEVTAIPPRQPITVRRSYANTDWARSLSPPCGDNGVLPATAGLPPAPGPAPAAALSPAGVAKLPAIPNRHRAGAVGSSTAAPIPLIPPAPNLAPAPRSSDGDPMAAVNALPTPDIGDQEQPAIVPVAPGSGCGGA